MNSSIMSTPGLQTVHMMSSGGVLCSLYLLEPGLWSRRGQVLGAQDLGTSGTSEEARNDTGLGPGVHLADTHVSAVAAKMI